AMALARFRKRLPRNLAAKQESHAVEQMLRCDLIHLMKTLFIRLFAFVIILDGTCVLAGSPAGRVVFWTPGPHTNIPSNLSSGVLSVNGNDVTNAIAIAAGDSHAIVLSSDGSVIGMGDNSFGQAVAGSGELLGWRNASNGTALRFESTYTQLGAGQVNLL